MAISKSKREAVYRKYDGHCAYCGREIAYKDMQVDHFQPLRAWGIEDAGTDELDNLMPACRMCNHYKRANSGYSTNDVVSYKNGNYERKFTNVVLR